MLTVLELPDVNGSPLQSRVAQGQVKHELISESMINIGVFPDEAMDIRRMGAGSRAPGVG